MTPISQTPEPAATRPQSHAPLSQAPVLAATQPKKTKKAAIKLPFIMSNDASRRPLFDLTYVDAQLFWHFEYDVLFAANQLDCLYATQLVQTLDHLLHQHVRC